MIANAIHDWERITIAGAIQQKFIVDHMDGNHGELYPRSHEFQDFGVPYVSANDFKRGVVELGSCKKLSATRAAMFKKGISIDGDVLFAHNATVGPSAVLRTSLPFVILSTTATYFRCDTNFIDSAFLKYFFESDDFVRQYSAVMSQSTRNQVPITTQRKFWIYKPNLPEQKAIAKALSDTDALIAALEKVITKKQAIKTATMQQLLTGKTRLPGFGEGKGYKDSELGRIPEDWEVAPLLSVAELIHGKAHEPFVESGGQYTVVNSKFVSTAGSVVKHCTRNICPARMGDVLMVLSDLPNGRALSRCYSVNSDDIYAVNQRVCIFRPKVVDSLFLYYRLNRNKYFLALDDGVTQTHILNDDIAKCNVVLPCEIEEQESISSLLQSMQSEIDILGKKISKYRSVKTAMMQQLLTGRTRLV